jgi:hypothetical protein
LFLNTGTAGKGLLNPVATIPLCGFDRAPKNTMHQDIDHSDRGAA